MNSIPTRNTTTRVSLNLDLGLRCIWPSTPTGASIYEFIQTLLGLRLTHPHPLPSWGGGFEGLAMSSNCWLSTSTSTSSSAAAAAATAWKWAEVPPPPPPPPPPSAATAPPPASSSRAASNSCVCQVLEALSHG